MIIHEMPQNSDLWFSIRAGVLTASEADNLITPKGEPRKGQMPLSYLHRKLSERWISGPLAAFTSFPTEQGKLMESEVIPWLKLEHDLAVRRVGFLATDDSRCGCSPDGLIDDDCGLEIKCPQLPNHVAYLLGGTLPLDYVAQLQFSMFVSGFSHWKFVSYARSMPPLMLDVPRDPRFQDTLAEVVAGFVKQLDAAFNRLIELGGKPKRRSTVQP